MAGQYRFDDAADMLEEYWEEYWDDAANMSDEYQWEEEEFYYEDPIDVELALMEDLAEDFEEECRKIEEDFDDNNNNNNGGPRKMRRMNMRNARAQSARRPRKKRADKDLDPV